MDLAYDHIQEQALSQEQQRANPENAAAVPNKPAETTLNSDLQEAYKAISSSPWGARLGGFLGSVVKQGEKVYKEAQQELSVVGEEASKGFTDLRSTIITRTRAISLAQTQSAPTIVKSSADKDDADNTGSTTTDKDGADGVLARLRIEAAKRLKEIEKAEDAADEALLKFGTNIRNFLRDAVTITPSEQEGTSPATVLFESKDSQGKRVIHTTRFDAQLHAVHSALDSFTKDPEGEEYNKWKTNFSVEAKTDDIAKHLDDYPELRASMEKLVPDQVAYGDFWRRYYFLRHSIETAEARRRDLLKGAATTGDEEDVRWDEDSDEETPAKVQGNPAATATPNSTASSTTLHPATQNSDNANVKTKAPRISDEKSRADSEASYDVVGGASGAPSRAPNSPKETRKADDSDDEDWE